MQFSKLTLLTAATLASAENLVTFLSMDSTDRTLVWTGSSTIEDTDVPGNQNVTVSVPDAWIGNIYSVSSGATNTPGMLAEFAFNSFAGQTYFDVSAIVNPEDNEGIYQIWPDSTETPVSGCQTFACANAYYAADDIQTKSTGESHLYVSLGAGPKSVSTVSSRDAEESVFPREAVTQANWTPSLKRRFTSALRWARRN